MKNLIILFVIAFIMASCGHRNSDRNHYEWSYITNLNVHLNEYIMKGDKMIRTKELPEINDYGVEIGRVLYSEYFWLKGVKSVSDDSICRVDTLFFRKIKRTKRSLPKRKRTVEYKQESPLDSSLVLF